MLLGSATPSLESFQNTKDGKYGLVSLTERFQGIELPEYVIANLTQEKEANTMSSHFSSVLLEEIKQALMNKSQVILFQNRRGYNPLS